MPDEVVSLCQSSGTWGVRKPTMVKKAVQSSHHRFRVRNARENIRSVVNIKANPHSTQVKVINSTALFSSPPGGGPGPTIFVDEMRDGIILKFIL